MCHRLPSAFRSILPSSAFRGLPSPIFHPSSQVSSTYYRHLGPADGAVEYFAKLGYVCPTRVNPADFVIEICFGFVESKKVLPAPSPSSPRLLP